MKGFGAVPISFSECLVAPSLNQFDLFFQDVLIQAELRLSTFPYFFYLFPTVSIRRNALVWGQSCGFFQISVRGYYFPDANFFWCGNSPPHCRSPPRSEFSKIQNEWKKKQWMAVIQKILTLVPSAGGMKKTLMKYTPLASILPTHATFWHLRTATR